MGDVDQTTRRSVLCAAASVVPSSFLFPFAASLAKDSVEDADDRPVAAGTLRIAVRLPEGRTFPPSTKAFIRTPDRDEWEEIPRSKSELTYEKELKAGQAYGIRVVATGYMTIERTIYVDRALVAIPVFLIPDGWPYYLARGVQIPVNPRPRLAGVALRKPVASAAEFAKLVKLADDAGFMRITDDPDSHSQLDDVNLSVLYFEPKDPNVAFFSFEPDGSRASPGRVPPHSRQISPDAVRQLRSVFAAYKARVGSPVTVRKGQVSILDNQYHISFAKIMDEAAVREFSKRIGARLLRALDPKARFWLIEFDDPQNLGRHLSVMAELVRSGDIASGEPNLLFQLNPHSSGGFVDALRRNLCLWLPDQDPYQKCQDNLKRQRVEEAWCYIAEHFEYSRRYGKPSVKLATIDVGITFDTATKSSTHPEVNAPRVTYCHVIDAEGGPCEGMPPSPPGLDHGMATYGIISADPDNGRGITGIAPNAAHLAVVYWLMWDPALLAHLLEWVGGIRTDPPNADPENPRPKAIPAIPAADIINCSQGVEGGSIDTLVDNALRTLTCEGRGGLGTILVFSAGNQAESIPTEDRLATHPSTIGVTNTQMTGSKEERQFANSTDGSNYSDFVDLCANGEGAPSLTANPDAPGPECDGAAPDKGVFLHARTSAAAAMVSGAVALMLSVNPDLNWKQVRRILCASAEKIDCANSDGNGQWVWSGTGPAQPRATPCSLPRGLNWFSKYYGYGRLDVYEAVKLAHNTTGQTLAPCP